MDVVGGEEGHLCAMVEKALRAKCKVGVETVPGRVATAPGKAQGQRSLRHIHTALKTCLIFS